MNFSDIGFFLFIAFFVGLLATVFVHLLFLVPFVPSKTRVVEKMIQAAKLKAGDTVYDLGCGDGRLLFAAEKKIQRLRAYGFEIAPLVYLLAWVRKILSGSTAKILFKNLFSADFRKANVIFCYLIPNVMPRLSEKIKRECRSGTKIISNTFHIPGLKTLKVLARDPKKGLPTIYVYRV